VKVAGVTWKGPKWQREEIQMIQQNYTSEELQALITEASFQLGKVLYAEGRDYARAVSLLADTVGQEPHNSAAHYYLGQAIRGQIEQDMYRRAEQALRTYLEQGAPIGHEEEVREFLRIRGRSSA
jgi:tetratricopeptide (TPR) repeat protein